VFWIDAHSESSISLRLKQIAKDNALNPPSADSALRWIFSLDSNWFMVFDNADERYNVIEKYIPFGNKGNILTTSRNDASARVTSFASHLVDQMEEEEALSLLLKSSNLRLGSGSSNAAKCIVDVLGYIPLAIDQAGAYIQQKKCGLDCYLDLYKRHHKDLMSDPHLTGASGYGSSIYRTWDISMEEIKHRAGSSDEHIAHPAECALALHGIFAFLDKENISEDIFENAAANYKHNEIIEWKEPYPQLSLDAKVLPLDPNGNLNRIVFYAGIQVLKSFALIKGDSKSYSVHQLVHMWSRDRLLHDTMISNWESARALLASSVKVNQDGDNHTFLRMLLPHIKANNKYAVDLNLGIKYHDEIFSRFAYLYDTQGNWDDAKKLREKIVEERGKLLGENHLSTVESRSDLAMAYYEQGRLNEAKNILEKVSSQFTAVESIID
jgi:tetratricopeptide (TPR) repeat protein